ncbi:MAG: hypothetical protein U0736_01950 [Gemmataceae bacterium]
MSRAKIRPVAVAGTDDLTPIVGDRTLIVAAGAAGVVRYPPPFARPARRLKVAIDLNAVTRWVSRELA